MKRKIFFFIGILIIGLITFGPASRAFAQDLIATMVRQTIDAMITPTPTVSIKDIKIGVFVNQTVEAYYTGTPTPLPKPENLETAVYGTLEAMKPTATPSAEDLEIAIAVHQTVQALFPPAPTADLAAQLRQTIAAFEAARNDSAVRAQTMMAQTISALETAAAGRNPVVPTQSAPVWNPAVPAAPPAPPPVVPTARPCESFRFVADVSIPDGTVMKPGQSFTKTWRIQNTGSCVWSTAYQLSFARGDQMNAPAGVPLTRNVNPGESVDLTVPMVAPMASGKYRGNWLMRSPSGQLFGLGSGGKDGVWVDIRVQAGSAPPPPASPPQQFRCEHVSTVFNDVRMPEGIDAIQMTINLKNTGSATWSKDNVDLVFTSARFWTDGYISVGKRYDLANSVSPGNSATFTVICDDCYDDLFESPANNVIWTLMSGSDRICEFDLTKNKIENW